MTWSEGTTRARALLAVLAAGALVALGGCGRETPLGFHLRPLVAAGRFEVGGAAGGAGLRFPVRPRLASVEIDHEVRPVVVTPAGPSGAWTWRGRVPAGARLHAGVQALPAAGPTPGTTVPPAGLVATAVVRAGREREVLAVARSQDPANARWLDLEADLSAWAGQEVTLELSTEAIPSPPTPSLGVDIAWGPVAVSTSSVPPRKRPNILFILVDTLRRDHLTPYGYRRDTTPEIAARLAAPGTVVEEAYSQAPWTLPSVVSFLTGRYPGELLGSDLATYGVPPGVPTLAERLAGLGYETGGFIANPSLHAGAGFERGFGTFFAPPADVEWIRHHADELTARAAPWLAAHQDRPFFLYVHYIDPHDPYENPEIVAGRSPFLPDYAGPVDGEWVHPVYTGQRALPDPARDIPQLIALYDSEVHYADRFIGQLLAGLSPEVLANTLIVLTADHGEELHDHGGWKHGQTLYEEQIHVPLFFRWDGHIAAGKRLPGTVRLLDLAPTLIGAAGGRPDPAWRGIDLLPALTGSGPLPQKPSFSQHLSSGPLRAAAVAGQRKLILFDSTAPFNPADGLQEHLWRTDLARMARSELYDLARDPGERVNLLAGGEAPGRLAPVIHRQLDRELPGLRVIADGITSAPGGPAGSRLGGTIILERPPSRWTPYFLAPGDRVSLSGTRITFDLGSESLDKGFLVEGDYGQVLSLEARRDGVPLGAGAIRLGQGVPYSSGPIGRRLLLAGDWPPPPAAGTGAGMRLWLHTAARIARLAHDPETERRLRALGYIE